MIEGNREKVEYNNNNKGQGENGTINAKMRDRRKKAAGQKKEQKEKKEGSMKRMWDEER